VGLAPGPRHPKLGSRQIGPGHLGGLAEENKTQAGETLPHKEQNLGVAAGFGASCWDRSSLGSLSRQQLAFLVPTYASASSSFTYLSLNTSFCFVWLTSYLHVLLDVVSSPLGSSRQ
jgi:hypothetical protein